MFCPSSSSASLHAAGLLACDQLRSKADGADASVSVTVPAVTATVNATATATPTDTTQPAATIGGSTTPATPGHPAVHTDGGVVHADGGAAPAAPGFVIPTSIPGFDAGALRLPAGFDAGALRNPFQR